MDSGEMWDAAALAAMESLILSDDNGPPTQAMADAIGLAAVSAWEGFAHYPQWIALQAARHADALVAERAKRFSKPAPNITEMTVVASPRALNRYPWADAPEWAQYATTDSDKEMMWWENEPEAVGEIWGAPGRCAHIGFDTDAGGWAESIERRPS